MLVAFGVPMACMVLYLDRVLQIMNTFARYYLPYTPMIVVPALLVLDGWLEAEACRGQGETEAFWEEQDVAGCSGGEFWWFCWCLQCRRGRGSRWIG